MSAPTLRHVFGPDGEMALRALAAARPLLAFDFDGTLAPIVARPDDARVPTPVARRLERLAARAPLAIVTGRAVADVAPRLGFAPRWIVGNHGAEDAAREPAAQAAEAAVLDDLRLRLADTESLWRAAGVAVEDKGSSIALHYRLARDRPAAERAIAAVLDGAPASLRLFGGKLVVNAVAAGAPDKAAAVFSLLERAGCDRALFAGDDVNDEAVFAAAPPEWLTLRVGRDDPTSRARFVLDGPGEVARLLDRLLALLPAP